MQGNIGRKMSKVHYVRPESGIIKTLGLTGQPSGRYVYERCVSHGLLLGEKEEFVIDYVIEVQESQYCFHGNGD